MLIVTCANDLIVLSQFNGNLLHTPVVQHLPSTEQGFENKSICSRHLFLLMFVKIKLFVAYGGANVAQR
jgi:hypothetical protein